VLQQKVKPRELEVYNDLSYTYYSEQACYTFRNVRWAKGNPAIASSQSSVHMTKIVQIEFVLIWITSTQLRVEIGLHDA